MTGSATLPLLGVMAMVLGLTAAVDAPVRLAFPREIVGQQLLKSAIGLNGIVFQGARVVGPAVAGLVIVRWNESIGFFVAAGCGVVALMLLALVSSTPARVAAEGVDVRWRTTLRFIRGEPALLSPLIGAVVVGACLSNLQVALPLVLDRMPSAGAGDFGLLVATIGAGGACGALIASVVRRGQTLLWLNLFLIAYALAALVVAAMPTVALMAIVIFVTGLVMQLYNTNAITILQDASPDGQHGRVMGVYVVAFFVWASFGTPLFGLAAGAFGPREMLAVSSLICALAGGALLVLRPSRPGVDPGVAEPNELIQERR
jgi:MFS family permease